MALATMFTFSTKVLLYELFARKFFMFPINNFLLFIFFNSNGREFQNIMSLYVKKFLFKFVDTMGRETIIFLKLQFSLLFLKLSLTFS